MRRAPTGINAKAKADKGAKTRMKGILRPKRVLVLSLTGPMTGWIKPAAILSKVMTKPVSVAERPKPRVTRRVEKPSAVEEHLHKLGSEKPETQEDRLLVLKPCHESLQYALTDFSIL
ncbi:MAG: hypothetical protein FD137_1151 [Spirochaetes bacterium]|nr:MAG: hypothetical protein FD137_1151 [Spirochaetota bacterium]